MTVREFFESGRKGGFAQQLLRTYDHPTVENIEQLYGVADGDNRVVLDDLSNWGQPNRLVAAFPMLQELDRELDPSDYARLPREAVVGGNDGRPFD